MNTDKGGVGIPLFHCEFNHIDGSLTHYLHEVNTIMYDSLENLYAVCIAVKSSNERRILAGFFIKTSFSHLDQEFLEHLELVVREIPELKKFLSSNASFLPAKIGISGPPPTESEMLDIIIKQYTKLSTAGNS